MCLVDTTQELLAAEDQASDLLAEARDGKTRKNTIWCIFQSGTHSRCKVKMSVIFHHCWDRDVIIYEKGSEFWVLSSHILFSFLDTHLINISCLVRGNRMRQCKSDVRDEAELYWAEKHEAYDRSLKVAGKLVKSNRVISIVFICLPVWGMQYNAKTPRPNSWIRIPIKLHYSWLILSL